MHPGVAHPSPRTSFFRSRPKLAYQFLYLLGKFYHQLRNFTECSKLLQDCIGVNCDYVSSEDTLPDWATMRTRYGWDQARKMMIKDDKTDLKPVSEEHLPSRQTFLLRFSDATRPESGVYHGRVEHLGTGKTVRFTCPWRNPNSSGQRKFKQSSAVLFPSVLVDICHLAVGRFHRRDTIPPRMSPALVIIALIIAEFVLQVSRRPEQRVIQQLSPNAANQSFYKWMRHRHMWN